jgi:hypothetical protein
MSSEVNAVNFVGPATERPVDNDTYVFDEKTQQRRLKKCSEHYSKFVTELWFSVRAVVQCKQARDFPREVAEEFAMREWYFVAGNKYELETKTECKKRMGQSPNDADATAIAVEGARRLGFQIQALPNKESQAQDDSWLEKELQKHRKFIKSHELSTR